jgi:hypothetical protein
VLQLIVQGILVYTDSLPIRKDVSDGQNDWQYFRRKFLTGYGFDSGAGCGEQGDLLE